MSTSIASCSLVSVSVTAASRARTAASGSGRLKSAPPSRCAPRRVPRSQERGAQARTRGSGACLPATQPLYRQQSSRKKLSTFGFFAVPCRLCRAARRSRLACVGEGGQEVSSSRDQEESKGAAKKNKPPQRGAPEPSVAPLSLLPLICSWSLKHSNARESTSTRYFF